MIRRIWSALLRIWYGAGHYQCPECGRRLSSWDRDTWFDAVITGDKPTICVDCYKRKEQAR